MVVFEGGRVLQTYVYLNSKNRSSGTVSNFTTKLPVVLENVISIMIRSVDIPITYYVINSTNNTFKFNGSGLKTVTITAGNYSANDLATEIQTRMNATAFTGTTVVYSDLTNKFVFTNAVAFNLVFAANTFAPIIGLTADTASSTTVTTQNVIDISGTNHIFVVSNNLLQGIDRLYISDTSQKNILHKVSVDAYPTQVLTDRVQDYHANEHFYASQVSINDINLQLVDEDFVELNLNGADWNIELVVKYRSR
jgi:hypothetical protein